MLGRRLSNALGVGLAVAVATLALPGAAGAVGTGDALFEIGPEGTGTGSGAGQFKRSVGVATDPANGHIFLIDGDNNRIDEFKPWGEFVKAFGWDVAPAGVNEQQEVTVKATSGQFKLGFEGQETAGLEHDASPAEVESALNALSTISAGSGAVKVGEGASDAASSRYVIAFKEGPLKEANVAQLTATDVSLAGGSPSSSVTASTRADGHTTTTGLESCTTESGCKAGSSGFGAGQFAITQGIAVGPNGDIYARDSVGSNQRVQVFDPAGRFLFMLGGEVDKTTNADICTKASGDECGAGVPGTGPGAFSAGFGIATDPVGNVFVADKERIEEFEADGTFVRSIAVPGHTVQQLAVDPTSGDFLVLFGGGDNKVHRIDSSGTELEACAIEVTAPHFVATDAAGHVYVAYGPVVKGGVFREQVGEFSSACPPEELDSIQIELINEKVSNVTGIATNGAGDVLIARSANSEGRDLVGVFGPAPVQYEPPPPVAPEIGAQFATYANQTEARLRAKINPEFWADSTYYLEYGTGKCSESGCPAKAPVSPALLGAGAVRRLVTTEAVELSGLEPATTYHYRFVAQSSGGGPVYGLDPDGEGPEEASFEDGVEGSFRTFAMPTPPPHCANDAFRLGTLSEPLPDCRAYEMVSPVDKEGGDTLALIDSSGFALRFDQAAPDGNGLTYSSYRAFGDAQAAPYTSQYIARRGAEGWESEALAPARSGPAPTNIFGETENDFKAFTTDLCSHWLVRLAPPVLAAGAVAKLPNLYRGDSCPPPRSYEALTTVTPPEELPVEYGFFWAEAPELQGHSADGAKAVFRAPWKMAGEAAGGGIFQVYEASGGALSLVCILPNGTALGANCTAGGGAPGSLGESAPELVPNSTHNLSHAMSEDGSRIYWTAQASATAAAGKIYLRVGGSETKKVSETQSSLAAQFLAASADGGAALFEVTEGAKKEKLYRYSLEAEASVEIAAEVMGVAGASEDLSHVYYVSKQAVGGPNGEGKSPVGGQPNLYLFDEGTKTFVATLGAGDVRSAQDFGNGGYSDITLLPIYHVARATPSGAQLAFISAEPLTGADNTDANSGQADQEVFRYDAATARIACVSCSPAGARPQGRNLEVPGAGRQWSAAMIPGADNQLHAPRAIADDGARLFFTSYTPLLPTDANTKADVYEWEAVGSGSCEETAPAYSPANAGCLYLISSGEAEEDSELIESTPSGEDVFFITEQSLLTSDPGLYDVYDARALGGFAQPSEVIPCDPGKEPGEGGCREAVKEPEEFGKPAPPSGEANPPIVKPPHPCPKGTHRVKKHGKARCVKNHKKNHKPKHHKKAGKSGGAGR